MFGILVNKSYQSKDSNRVNGLVSAKRVCVFVNSIPGVDRSTKPNSLLSPTSSMRLGLRTVVVPHILHAKFILLAQKSTERNVETCGILAGRLVSSFIYKSTID